MFILDEGAIRTYFELNLFILQRRKQTTNAVKALDSMGDVLLGKSDKDSNITLQSPKLKMSVAKVGGGNGQL